MNVLLHCYTYLSFGRCARFSALFNMPGSGATAKHKLGAIRYGSAPGAAVLLQLSWYNCPETRGLNIRAADRVDVRRPRLRERSSLALKDAATRAAVDVSAIAAPARFSMYSKLCRGCTLRRDSPLIPVSTERIPTVHARCSA